MILKKRETIAAISTPHGRGGIGIIGASMGDTDYVTSLLVESTHDEMLLFTKRGKCYPLKIYEIPEAGRTSKEYLWQGC